VISQIWEATTATINQSYLFVTAQYTKYNKENCEDSNRHINELPEKLAAHVTIV